MQIFGGKGSGLISHADQRSLLDGKPKPGAAVVARLSAFHSAVVLEQHGAPHVKTLHSARSSHPRIPHGTFSVPASVIILWMFSSHLTAVSAAGSSCIENRARAANNHGIPTRMMVREIFLTDLIFELYSSISRSLNEIHDWILKNPGQAQHFQPAETVFH